MTLSELVTRSGYAETTIKFFLREKLLQPGEKISERLASYDEPHLQRLRLVEALHEKLELSYHDIKRVTSELDKPGVNVYNILGIVQWLIVPKHTPSEDTKELSSMLEKNGVFTTEKAYVQNLAGTVEEANALGIPFHEHELEQMIKAIRTIVHLEMKSGIPLDRSNDEIVRYSALGMFYTSVVSQQLTRMIEQTEARKMIVEESNQKG